jgi:hypothetical protein
MLSRERTTNQKGATMKVDKYDDFYESVRKADIIVVGDDEGEELIWGAELCRQVIDKHKITPACVLCFDTLTESERERIVAIKSAQAN